jgi:cell wall-associated NlpC family hydrolase
MGKSPVIYTDLIGTPFKYGGRGPEAYDCYGLVMELQRRMGIEIPDYKSPQNMGEIASLLACEIPRWIEVPRAPGTVVALRIGRYVSHVGLMIDNDRMVHTWEQSGGVCVECMYDWERRVAGFFRYRT